MVVPSILSEKIVRCGIGRPSNERDCRLEDHFDYKNTFEKLEQGCGFELRINYYSNSLSTNPNHFVIEHEPQKPTSQQREKPISDHAKRNACIVSKHSSRQISHQKQ